MSVVRAFSNEVAAGSREENASNKNLAFAVSSAFSMGRRFSEGIEPLPIDLVALQLPLVDLAALRRAELLEVPAMPDQSEGPPASWIAATACHEAASAFARQSQRMKFS
ncbi:hypothetical protein AAFG13_28190 [Bradyrhizobium sp. B124]|uniref:hypothetical protein n=1 Tax=Bradyrhizobium sp. B124 TaxID=3140245 RepID=UPI003183612B